MLARYVLEENTFQLDIIPLGRRRLMFGSSLHHVLKMSLTDGLVPHSQRDPY